MCGKTVLSTAVKERLILRMCFCHLRCPTEILFRLFGKYSESLDKLRS
jgi:hypothetical protein